MMDLERPKTIASGKFTAAYVTISEEYYDGPAIPEESTGESSGEGSSPATPAFTALYTVLVLVISTFYRKE